MWKSEKSIVRISGVWGRRIRQPPHSAMSCSYNLELPSVIGRVTYFCVDRFQASGGFFSYSFASAPDFEGKGMEARESGDATLEMKSVAAGDRARFGIMAFAVEKSGCRVVKRVSRCFGPKQPGQRHRPDSNRGGLAHRSLRVENPAQMQTRRGS